MKATTSFSPEFFEFDRPLIERLEGSGPRYTSYPTADRFTEAFTAVDYQQRLKQRHIGANSKSLSLYVHLPFCDTVCYYCACNKIVTKDHHRADIYLDYLEKEIALVAKELETSPKVAQLHLGGGTPTFLSDTQLERLMQMLRQHFEFLSEGEFSIEIDPRQVSRETVLKLVALGFNRVSVGVQDTNLQVQQAVNRVQSLEETESVIQAVRDAGFKSVSVDLIYGLPLQTCDSMAKTLEQVIAISPDRIALYNYAHLPNLFKPQRRVKAEDLPASSVKLDILQGSVNQLSAAGYVFIGMDHFAKPQDDLAVALRQGRLHRNFQGYSTYADCDLIAFGVSAISKVGPCYAQNQRDLEAYYTALDAGSLPVMRGLQLTADDILRRSIIQALMCRFAVSIEAMEEVFNINFAQYFAKELPKIREFQLLGLVHFDGDFLTVEPKGRLLIRNIAMIFDRHLRDRNQHAQFSKVI